MRIYFLIAISFCFLCCSLPSAAQISKRDTSNSALSYAYLDSLFKDADFSSLFDSSLFGTKSADQFVTTRERACKVWMTAYTPNRTVSWSGECHNGYAEGSGTRIVYDHDTVFSTYTGPLVHGKREGKGTNIWAEDGTKYTGDWHNDSMSGHGTRIVPGISIYEGDFAAAKPHGKGKLTYLKSGDVVEGDFRNGRQNGYVIRRYKSGDLYQGNMKDDARNGKGKYTFADGRYYDGDWKMGDMAGYGTYYKKDGTTYTGHFTANTYDGKGKLTSPDGAYYDWEWLTNERSGSGTQHFASGENYTGSFLHNKRNGKGKFTFADGTYYDGEWKDDNKHGAGEFKDKTGKLWVGTWKDGAWVTPPSTNTSNDAATQYAYLDVLKKILRDMLEDRNNGFATYKGYEVGKEGGTTSYLLKNVTDYPSIPKNAILPMLESSATGSMYSLNARGMELPAAIGVIYQDLLTPSMKTNGYSMSADVHDPLLKKYTISYSGIPVSVCQIDAGKGETTVIILGK